MDYSQVFGQTSKTAPSGAETISHRLLYRGGFVRRSSAGHYYFLPLGWRVHQKIEAVVREEMNRIGGQEMLTPILHPIELWQETNRDQAVNFELMTVENRQDSEFALGGTAEEMFVDLVRNMNLSYRDLPLNLYQFSTKFRDELRPRGGLLRVREFIMKDAYSFDANEEEFRKHYQTMKGTYQRIFDRMGLETLVVEADSGYIGGEYCHEFICPAEAGEDTVLACSDCDYQANQAMAEFRREPKNPNEELKPFKMIDQPEWVTTMADNVKHYGEPEWRYLKNVVYKDENGRIIIASIRGDQVVSEVKLKNLLKVSRLEPADEADLAAIDTQAGWVHSWGHDEALYVGDIGLKMVKNFIGGQKEKDRDSKNVNYGREFEYEILGDIAQASEGAACSHCSSGRLQEKRGIEVGHIFQLGYHYTKKMSGANFTDAEGQTRPFYMGCYGIGLGRAMATVVETSHDRNGIIWPPSITPYQFHLISLDRAQQTRAIGQKLEQAGFSVLVDKRPISAGEKFADADLIGIPIRLVVSRRTKDKTEWKRRSEQKTSLLNEVDLLERANNFY